MLRPQLCDRCPQESGTSLEASPLSPQGEFKDSGVGTRKREAEAGGIQEAWEWAAEQSPRKAESPQLPRDSGCSRLQAE